MDIKSLVFILIMGLLINVGCNENLLKERQNSVWIKPAVGTQVNLGEKLDLQVQVSNKYDSVLYFVDNVRLEGAKNLESMSFATHSWGLGNRLITAHIFRQGQIEEISTNIILKSALLPQKFDYSVEHIFPHDINSYTEGLEYYKGFLYESGGEYGKSTLRKVEISSGKVLEKTTIRPELFAEGITIVGDKILQLTYKENLGIVYDLKSLKPIREYPCQNPREGWGLCFDGNKIYNTDGSNMIYFLNKDTFREEGYIEVYDHQGPVSHLNELEYIDGNLYANVFMTDRIVIINPRNGQVIGEIDLSRLYPAQNRNPQADVLNGIAWDKQGRRLFVTGKKWDKLFQIRLRSAATKAD